MRKTNRGCRVTSVNLDKGGAARMSRARVALAAAVVGTVGVVRSAPAGQFIYTPSNTASDLWSAANGWSGTPVSDPTTQLTFVSPNTTVLASGLTDTNTD